MSTSKVNNENYFTVQGWMVKELGLKGNDLIIFAIIYGFSQDGQSKFTGSLQYLADWTNSTKQGCTKNLKNLIEQELIVKTENEINNIKLCSYSVNIEKVTGIKQRLIPIKQRLPNNINNNIDNINNINIINSENEEETKNDILEKPKKEISTRQKNAIERNKILEEFIKDEDEDIKKALKNYVEIRRKRGLEPKQLQIILEDFEKAYKYKSKQEILEQIRKATAGGWMQLVYNFNGKLKSSYGSRPTFDNTANHDIKIIHITDEEFEKLSHEDKIKKINEFSAVADMTEKQKQFYKQYCLARDENGNLLKF